MASGEEIWDKGGQSDAGSDLVDKNKSPKDGEWFVINGQKTWCSRGAWAIGYFASRTDPDSERHQVCPTCLYQPTRKA